MCICYWLRFQYSPATCIWRFLRVSYSHQLGSTPLPPGCSLMSLEEEEGEGEKSIIFKSTSREEYPKNLHLVRCNAGRKTLSRLWTWISPCLDIPSLHDQRSLNRLFLNLLSLGDKDHNRTSNSEQWWEHESWCQDCLEYQLWFIGLGHDVVTTPTLCMWSSPSSKLQSVVAFSGSLSTFTLAQLSHYPYQHWK